MAIAEGQVDEEPSSDSMVQVSDTLGRARARARALSGPPAGLPATLEEAYAIQHSSRANWNDSVAGWKVGGVPAAYRERFAQERLTGPIFARSVRRVESGNPVAMPVFDGGFAAIEPELVLELGDTRSSDRLYIGAEIASSPIPAINDYGPVAVIADFGNNNGVLLAGEIADWRERADPIHVTATVEGEVVGDTVLHDPLGNVFGALDFLLGHAEAHGIAMPAGTLVATGAITGIHEARVGARAHIDYGDLGSFALELVAAEPV